MNNYKLKILFVGILLLILFLCLLSLFYPKYNSREINNNTFNSNIRIMEKRSINYLTYNIIPNNNDKIITLKELYDLNIIPLLTDEYNNECSKLSSYILLQKELDNYKLSTTLVCGNKVGTVVTYFK